MINNSFFKLLFDYRGVITRRQYWAALVVVLICLLFIPAMLSKPVIMNVLLLDGKDVTFYSAYSILQSTINMILGIGLPLQFIALYISLVATIKRCRALFISTKQAFFHGVSTYFVLPCLYTYLYISIMIQQMSGIFEIFSDDLSFLITRIIFIILLVIGVISVIYLSLRTTDLDQAEERHDGVDSIICLFYIARLILISTVITIVLAFQIISKKISIYNDSTWMTLTIVFLLIYIIAFLYIYLQRAKDARVKGMYVLGVFFGYVLLTLGIMYLIMNVLTSPMSVVLIDVVQGLLTSTIFILAFVLIALPSKPLFVNKLTEEDHVID